LHAIADSDDRDPPLHEKRELITEKLSHRDARIRIVPVREPTRYDETVTVGNPLLAFVKIPKKNQARITSGKPKGLQRFCFRIGSGRVKYADPTSTPDGHKVPP